MTSWLVAAAALAHPLAEGPLATRFSIHPRGIADGLPQSSVTDLAQDAHGFLHVGTFGGLARYDGARFVVVDAALGLPGVRFTAVATTPDGRVWAGTEHGRIAVIDGRTVTTLPDPPTEGTGGVVWDLLPAGDDLWVATDAGLLRWRGGQWTRIAAEGGATAIARADGVVWAAGRDRIVRVEGERVDLLDPPVPAAVLAVTTEPATAVAWFATSEGLAVVEDGRARLVRPGRADRAAVHVDGEGRLWLGADGDLELLGPAERLRAGEAGEALARWGLGTRIRVITSDAEGDVWVGTDTDGLLRLAPLPFDRYGVDRGLPERSVGVIETGGPEVVLAAGCSGLVTLAGERFAPLAGAEGRECVSALWRAPDGALWVGHNDFVEPLGAGPPLDLGARVIAIRGDGRGRVFAGTHGGGAFRVDEGRAEPVAGLEGRRVAVIEQAPDGALWFGLDTGVAVLREGRLAHLSAAEEVPPDVRAIRFDPDGTAWLGTYGHGLARVRDGRGRRLTEAEGLPEDVASVLLDDGRGHLWSNGNRGVWRVPWAELDAVLEGRAATVRALLFPTGEGNGGSTPAGGVDRAGGLWFATIDGAVRFDPDAIPFNAVAPVPVIEEITVGGVSWPAQGGFTVPPGRRETAIRFTAAALREPTFARFQYRMLPHEPWSEARPERLVHYATLPPGPVTFEVRAANESGVWSTTPARVSFVVAPWPTETTGFRVGVVLAAIGLSGGFVGLWTVSVRRRATALQREVEHRRRVEAELRTREAHYRALFEAASDGLVVVGADGTVVDANPAAAALFGRPAAELRGRAWDGLVARSGEVDEGVRADGTPFPARLSRVDLGEGKALVSVVDLAPLLDLQARLAQAERLEAIGRVAGSLAHDLNNLLTVIRGTAVELEERGDLPEAAVQLREVVQRGADLTRHLLAFGQRQALRPEPIELTAFVRRIEPILRDLLPAGVALALDLAPAGVRADPTQLELLIVQVVLAAAERAGGRGEVRLAIRRLPDAVARERWPALPPGDGWSVITVTDDGPPLPPEELERVFEPRLAPRQGVIATRLGLASVHGFVRQSAGHVAVRSDERTTLEVVLPAAEVPRVPSLPPVSAPAAEGSAVARVLVCDDDPFVRRAVERVLRSGGFRVRAVDSGAAALRALDDEPVDVLVTDVLMPGMSGAALAAAVRARWPDTAVVYVSGYTRDLLPTDLDGPLLKKPFEAPMLLELVRRAVGAR